MCCEYFENTDVPVPIKSYHRKKYIPTRMSSVILESFFLEICFRGWRHQMHHQTQLWEQMIKLCSNGNETWFLINVCAFEKGLYTAWKVPHVSFIFLQTSFPRGSHWPKICREKVFSYVFRKMKYFPCGNFWAPKCLQKRLKNLFLLGGKYITKAHHESMWPATKWSCCCWRGTGGEHTADCRSLNKHVADRNFSARGA